MIATQPDAIRAGVIGAYGRMGTATCAAIEAEDDLELAARLGREDPLDGLREHSASVAVDFTHPKAVLGNILWCLGNGIHAVVGTTGLGDADLRAVKREAEATGVNAIVAPNFALGAVLMMALAARAAPLFDTAEIVERHHEKKKDAPSGTAMRTAQLMNEARREPWEAAADSSETVAGARGGDAGGIRIHSLRVPGSVAHQDVILGSKGQTLTIRHDSLDRTSFMPGVVLAIRKIASLGGLTVGLEHLLDLR